MLSGDGAAGSYGYVEGPATQARWRSPGAGVVGVDPVSGVTALFVADTENHRIRMVYLDGPAKGYSILIAGSGIAGYSEGNGDPYNARYNYPRGITAIKDDTGVVEALLIADTDNHTIRLLLPPLGGTQWRPEFFSGQLGADFKDGIASESGYNSPFAIAVGNDGFYYVADSDNGAIRRLDWFGNSSTLFVTQPETFNPTGITSSEVSHWLYVSSFTDTINRVSSGQIELLSTAVTKPHHLVWADTGGDGSLFIADSANNRIRQFDNIFQLMSTNSGSGDAGYLNGAAANAQYDFPTGIAIGPSNELYIIDPGNHGGRKVAEQ
jgi:hypothetical protein